MKPETFTNRNHAQKRGKIAETIACWALRMKGYYILERNWRCPQGEIDIIARRGSLVIVVEVKHRYDRDRAFESIQIRQRVRIERALSVYLQRYPHLSSLTIRFDAIAMNRWYFPNHIADAWRPDPR